jgi:flagellar motor switch/type III secretory pathway protein FliN
MSNDPLLLPPPIDDFAMIGQVSVTLVAELDAIRVPFAEVAAWTAGSLIRLPSSAGETISLYVKDIRIGSAEVLVVDGVLTVRVSDLASPPGTAEPTDD